MRPVKRSVIPEENGLPLVFRHYSDARSALIKCLGEYCSYCEMHLDTSLAVEHVRPKKPGNASEILFDREIDWDNFLLACTNCNSTKGNKEVELDDYLWPDSDNTFLALKYSEGGRIKASQTLSSELQEKAQSSIELCGLDKTPLNQRASDRRWLNRREAWDLASRAKDRLARNDSDDFRNQVVETANAKGFWSIWMTVFFDDADMRRRLFEALPGTSSDCFDAHYKPVKRPHGQC